LAGLLAMSCANRGGGPQGGPKDIAPPIPIKSVPTNGATNYTNSTIDIYFDEIVVLEKSYEKIVVSPPQLKSPIVKAYGRKVAVELADSLEPNTTYIIDFSDAIVDNNEKNRLLDYYFSFSTGGDIDSLMIGGTLIDAHTLNPVSGVLVGIHSNLNDSAFQKLPFERISKTNIKPTLKTIEPHRLKALIEEDLKLYPKSKSAEIQSRISDVPIEDIRKCLFNLEKQSVVFTEGIKKGKTYSLAKKN
jgi:hypothetical protein